MYAEKKALLNSKPGLFIPDIRLSGQLYAGLFASRYEENILIGSSVDYSLSQEKRHSPWIFEPTPKNLSGFIQEHFRPELIKKLRSGQGLGLSKNVCFKIMRYTYPLNVHSYC